jgi:hypothetical protein
MPETDSTKNAQGGLTFVGPNGASKYVPLNAIFSEATWQAIYDSPAGIEITANISLNPADIAKVRQGRG